MPQSKKLKLDSALPVWDSGHGAIHASPDTHMISQLFPLAPHSAAAVNGNAGLNIVSDIMFGAHRSRLIRGRIALIPSHTAEPRFALFSRSTVSGQHGGRGT